jgi:hypothetical protein
MILELIFFIVVVAILVREVAEMRRPLSTKTVTHNDRPAGLDKLEAHAGRLFAERSITKIR